MARLQNYILAARQSTLKWLAALTIAFPAVAVAQEKTIRPYMGWSSWTLQAVKDPRYGKGWLNEDRIQEQSDALHETLQTHGFDYINIDSGWHDGYDEHGRPTAAPKTFPSGIKAIADHVHKNGQKLGIYYIPGISEKLYKDNPIIAGTEIHIDRIVAEPQRKATAFETNLAIDFSKPGAQEYIDSIAREFEEWGVDFLKFDGIEPNAAHEHPQIDARADVKAWSIAIKKLKHPIWLTLSWKLDPDHAEFWDQHANAWRVDQDVEEYGQKLTGWKQVLERFDDVPAWLNKPHRGCLDLDSLPVVMGEIDGLNHEEKRLAVTFWSMMSSPLYIGGDLTKLHPPSVELLTNDEVIAIDQCGIPAHRIAHNQSQIWRKELPNGSVVNAMFNLKDHEAVSFKVEWKFLGVDRPAKVRDVWKKEDLEIKPEFAVTLEPHSCRVIQLFLKK